MVVPPDLMADAVATSVEVAETQGSSSTPSHENGLELASVQVRSSTSRSFKRSWLPSRGADAIAQAAGVSSFWQEEQRSHHLHFPSLVYDTYTYASDVPFAIQMKANYSWVMSFAIAGVACRHGVGKLAIQLGIAAPSPRGIEGDGDLEAVVVHDLLANIVGSFLMGACVGASPWIIPRFPAIYAGLTTGFCGCFTTFSSWNNAAASIMLRGQVARAVACLVIGFTAASYALKMGAQASSKTLLMLVLEQREDGRRPSMPPPPPHPLYNTYKLPVGVACSCTLLVGLGVAASVALHEDTPDASLYLGLCFSPFFAALRYHLSALNKAHPTLPRYTLIANALASVLTSTAAGLGRSERVGASALTRSVLEALSLGGAGSLSTVSSFVNECRLLAPRHAARYIVMTLLIAQASSASVLTCFRALDGWNHRRL